MRYPNSIEFLVLALAVWRVSALFAYEVGPFNVFLGLRKLVGIHHNDEGEPEIIPDHFFGNLFSCVWCFSLWASLAIVTLWLIWPAITNMLCLILALSAASILVESAARR